MNNITWFCDSFICWTSFKLIDEDETLCPKPPNVAIDEARSFGLLTVDYEIIDADASEDYMAKVNILSTSLLYTYEIVHKFNIFF